MSTSTRSTAARKIPEAPESGERYTPPPDESFEPPTGARLAGKLLAETMKEIAEARDIAVDMVLDVHKGNVGSLAEDTIALLDKIRATELDVRDACRFLVKSSAY